MRELNTYNVSGLGRDKTLDETIPLGVPVVPLE